MNARFFLDTNVLVYAFQSADLAKQDRAKELLERALSTGQGVVSVQVAQEFLNVATRKWKEPLSASDAVIFIEKVIQPLCVPSPTPELLKTAVRLQEETGYGFYDSLILASAMEADCGILYSEDFQSGQNLKKLKIIDPFKAAQK